MKIAASNSSDYDKGQSELVCNGTNDRTLVQQAFGAENEKVVVCDGIYNVSKGANGVDGNPYIYPARGVVVQGTGNAVFLADGGICRVMCKKPNTVLSGLSMQGYIHIQNYESNQIFRDLKLSNKLPGQRWLDWRKKGGCTGHIQNWTPKGTTMSSIVIERVTLEDSYHHGIGFHLNNAQEGGTWKDITITGCTITSPGSGLEMDKVPGDRDWSTGIDVDTGDIVNMMIRSTTITDPWQSAFHTDGSWTGHSQTVKNLVFENCVAIGAGKRAGTIPKEMYEAGFYIQDAVLKNCSTKDCRVGYLVGNVNSGGLTMVDCRDEGSDYSLAVEYGGNGATVANFTSKGAKVRALQMLGQGVKYTNFRIEDFEGSGTPIMLGKMGKLIYADAPSHKEDVKRYLAMRYSVSGRFDILSTYTQRDKLASVHTGSTMNWDGFTMTKIGATPPPVVEEKPPVVEEENPPIIVPVPVPPEDLSGRLKVTDMFIWVQDDDGSYVQTTNGQIPIHLQKKFRHGQVYGPVDV